MFGLGRGRIAVGRPTSARQAAVDPQVVEAHTGFAFKVLREQMAAEPGQNVLLSPLGLSLTLGLLYNGAAGETAAGMARGLGVEGLSAEQLNRGNAGLLAGLARSAGRSDLSIGTCLWSGGGGSWSPAIRDVSARYYDAELCDLPAADAAGAINRWVSARTGGEVRRVVEELSPDLPVVANAVVFRGRWARHFDSNDTREEPFYLEDGRQRLVPMMAFDDRPLYLFYSAEARGVRLPYKDSRLAMYVLLPNTGTLLQMVTGLEPARWREWASGFHRSPVATLRLPRFTLETEHLLSPTMSALGMEDACTSGMADFRTLGLDAFNLARLRQVSRLRVDEEGSAAFTITLNDLLGISSPLLINRPFLCVIQDDESGELLFVAAVMDPAP